MVGDVKNVPHLTRVTGLWMMAASFPRATATDYVNYIYRAQPQLEAIRPRVYLASREPIRNENPTSVPAKGYHKHYHNHEQQQLRRLVGCQLGDLDCWVCLHLLTLSLRCKRMLRHYEKKTDML